MQPTRQNDRTGYVGGDERPIEDLSAAAVTLDVGVEQDNLGALEILREFTKSDPLAAAGCGGAQVGRRPGASLAPVSSPWNCSMAPGQRSEAASISAGVGVDQQRHRRHEGRQSPRQRPARSA